MFIEVVHRAERILAEMWNQKLFKNEAKDLNFLPVYTNQQKCKMRAAVWGGKKITSHTVCQVHAYQ